MDAGFINTSVNGEEATQAQPVFFPGRIIPVYAPGPCAELLCTVDIGDGDDRLVQAPRFSDAILTSVRQEPSRILLSADAPVIWKQSKFVGRRPTGIYVSLSESGSPQSLRFSPAIPARNRQRRVWTHHSRPRGNIGRLVRKVPLATWFRFR